MMYPTLSLATIH